MASTLIARAGALPVDPYSPQTPVVGSRYVLAMSVHRSYLNCRRPLHYVCLCVCVCVCVCVCHAGKRGQPVSSHYFLVTTRMNWYDADMFCRSLHARSHLIVITSRQEQGVVARLMKGL